VSCGDVYPGTRAIRVTKDPRPNPRLTWHCRMKDCHSRIVQESLLHEHRKTRHCTQPIAVVEYDVQDSDAPPFYPMGLERDSRLETIGGYPRKS
jgi:hypothetical protein